MFRFAAYVSAGTLSRPWHGGAVWAGMTACLNTTRIFPPLLRLLPGLKTNASATCTSVPPYKVEFYIFLFVFLTSFVCLPVCVCVCESVSDRVCVCVCVGVCVCVR